MHWLARWQILFFIHSYKLNRRRRKVPYSPTQYDMGPRSVAAAAVPLLLFKIPLFMIITHPHLPFHPLPTPYPKASSSWLSHYSLSIKSLLNTSLVNHNNHVQLRKGLQLQGLRHQQPGKCHRLPHVELIVTAFNNIIQSKGKPLVLPRLRIRQS